MLNYVYFSYFTCIFSDLCPPQLTLYPCVKSFHLIGIQYSEEWISNLLNVNVCTLERFRYAKNLAKKSTIFSSNHRHY